MAVTILEIDELRDVIYWTTNLRAQARRELLARRRLEPEAGSTLGI